MRDFRVLILSKLHRWSGRQLQREKLRRFLDAMGRNRNSHLN